MTSILVPACTDTPAPDELAGESDADGQEGKGDSAAAFGFLYVTPDTRACSFEAGPDCGTGFFVSTPNRATMRCGFTVPMSKCKVHDIDWTRTAMPASVAKGYEDDLRAGTPLLVRGELIPAPNDAGVHLSVSEIWLATSPQWAEGVFTLVKDNGLRCIKAPCPSMTEYKLNSNLSATISELDLEASGAPEELIDRAYRELYGDGVVVVGYRYYDRDGGKARTANKFFTRAPVPLFE